MKQLGMFVLAFAVAFGIFAVCRVADWIDQSWVTGIIGAVVIAAVAAFLEVRRRPAP